MDPTTISIYANHIDELKNLDDAIEHIANAHVNTRVMLESYPVIGEYLLTAIKEILDNIINSEIIKV